MIAMNVIKRAWDSPTITTWASFATRSLGMFLVLPLMLKSFSTGEIALWYLFSSTLGLIMLLDLGFAPTFIRSIAHANAGRSELLHPENQYNQAMVFDSPYVLIREIVRLMKFIYLVIAVLGVALLLSVGTYYVQKAVPVDVKKSDIHWAWMIMVCASFFQLYGSVFTSYLQGMNKVSVVRRWEAIAALLGVSTSLIILLNQGGFLLMLAGNYSWSVVAMLRSYILCYRDDAKLFKNFFSVGYSTSLLRSFYPVVWKSGVGILFSQGIIQGSSIIYAGYTDTKTLAMYLLSLNLLFQLRNFAMAPFYSKIPLLAKLYAQGKMDDVLEQAKKNMRLSHYAFALGFIFIGFFANNLLSFIHSNSAFASPSLWFVMGLGFFIERYGAMHIQLYSLTNKIIWHIANGVSGILILISSLILLRFVGIFAFPLGICIGYASFYCWYTAGYSFRLMKVGFWSFESTVSLIPFVLIILFSSLQILGLLNWAQLWN